MDGTEPGLADELRRIADERRLDGFGVCLADPFTEVRDVISSRVAAGMAADMKFTFARPETSTDVRRSFPWARRLAVAAKSYVPEAGQPGPERPGEGRIARFATRDHYAPLRLGLGEIAEHLRSLGFRAVVLADDNRLVDRAAAVRAGVAWWGKNTMVLAPRFGPWLLLGSVATDALIATTEPMERGCGSCTACLPACPTGALVSPGVLDARRCLAYWAQAPGVIPRQYRAPMGDRLYGCDDCLDACPPGQRLAATATGRGGRVDLYDVLGSDDRTLLARFAHFYIPGRQARYLRRNALVALGNGGGEDAVGVLAGYLSHPDWLLRSHASWGLGRLGSAAALAALEAQRAVEVDDRVAEELESAWFSAKKGRETTLSA